MTEFCLNVAPFPQPQPFRNPQGDCFACAMTAALRHLFPERLIEFDAAWKYFEDKYYQSEEKCLNNTWPGMRRALSAASRDGYRMDLRSDIVRPAFDADQWSYSWFRFFPEPEYCMRLEGWLRSGYVAFSEINFAGAGPISPDFGLNGTDHFVLIDGIRDTREVHVVCSVRGAYWIRAFDWLVKHGSAGWWLARRKAE